MSEDDTPLPDEEFYLRIKVISTKRGKRFLYQARHGHNELTAKTLFPADHSMGEEIEVQRIGRVIDSGHMRLVGTHAAFVAFTLKKHPNAQQLDAEWFAAGTIIVIKPTTWRTGETFTGFFAESMWMALTMVNCAIDSPYMKEANRVGFAP